MKTEISKRRHLMLLGTLTCITGKSKSKESFFTSIAQKSQHVTNGKKGGRRCAHVIPPPPSSVLHFRAFMVKVTFLQATGEERSRKEDLRSHRIKDHGSSRSEDRAITKYPNPCLLKRSSRATVQCLYKTANMEPMKP